MTLKQQGLRRCKHASSYFRGAYNRYGLYQWDIKYRGFNDDSEVESAVYMAFGEYYHKSQGFELLEDLLGRPIKSHIDGRSGGWLVIDTPLTDKELDRVDEYVDSVMKYLPEYLEELRKRS